MAVPVLTPAELADARTSAVELARSASHRILAGRPDPSGIWTKSGPGDYVTTVDQEIEAATRDALLARYPDFGIVGEECGTSPGSGPVWYLDPIDGTRNFVHALPWSAFSLGLADGAGPAVGVVANPYTGEIFSAARGQGASLGTDPLRPAARDTLAGALVLTEWPRGRGWDGMGRMVGRLVDARCMTQVMGSTVLALTYAAAGRVAGAVLDTFSPWDVYAGVALARESGLVVLSRERGGPLPVDAPMPDHGLAVVTPGVAEELRHAWLD